MRWSADPGIHRAATIAAFVAIAVLAGFLVWRAALPNNRYQGYVDFMTVTVDGDAFYLPRVITHYEDAVARTTAYNFAEDGFMRTHFLPNRKGYPRVSLYDFTGTMCEYITPPAHVLTHWNGLGQKVATVSANNDCIYPHYPPLSEWLFGAMAAVGLGAVFHFKLVAILVNCGFLTACFLWLEKRVHPIAALIAVVLTATLPGFLQWGDTLYYHTFQYLYLMCGLITWDRYLLTRQRRYLLFTYALFFMEAFSSFQLTFFFGIALLGLTMTKGDSRRNVKVLLLQATAPVLAFCAHVALIASLIGVERMWHNIFHTYIARTTELHARGFVPLLEWFGKGLIPWTLVLLAVVLVIAIRMKHNAPLKQPLCDLATLFAGGLSFTAVLPGTSSAHDHMMYRHLMPFVTLLIAHTADAAGLLAAGGFRRSKGKQRAARLGALLSCALFLGTIGYRNALRVRQEIGWNLARNAYHEPNNLVVRAIDSFYWREGVSISRGVERLPVSGMRVSEPPAWQTDFQIIGPDPSHYEVWWLKKPSFRLFRLLVNAREQEKVRQGCRLSFFDGTRFTELKGRATVTVTPFVPGKGERTPFEPYTWITFSLDDALPTRAIRLTCAGFEHATLRQIEAFEHPPHP